MKSVSINMNSPWEIELWKLCRRFHGESDSDDSGYVRVPLRFAASDALLIESNRYGFPSSGIEATLIACLSTEGELPEREIPRLVDIHTSESSTPLPRSLPDKLNSTFLEELSIPRSFRVFSSLKAVETRLSMIWIASVLESRPSQIYDANDSVSKYEVGRIITNDSNLELQVIQLTSQIVCMKCERPQDILVLDAYREDNRVSIPCGTCTRQLDVFLDRSSICGLDCAILQVFAISAWIYCPCGKDFKFIPDLKPKKKSNVDFTCSCGSITFSYIFESTTATPIRSVPSPKVDPENKSDRIVPRKFKEGVALPSSGACKHYKKSFRWIKYDCCEDWFACSQCHDGRVTDHECESKGATWMLCGFCSKEQRISNECLFCRKETTPGWSVKDQVSSDPVEKRRIIRRNKKRHS